MPFLTIASFLAVTGAVALATWWLTRRVRHNTAEGFFLAGRMLTGGFIAGSLLLTNLSTEQLVGLNGAAYTDGLCVMAWEVIAAFALVMMAWFFLPRFLKLGITTIPEFLEHRYGGRTRTITTTIFIAAYAVILLPMILYTGARGITDILDIKSLMGLTDDWTAIWIGVWFIGLLGSAYALVGGLHTVAVSDTLNGISLLIGGLLITWLGLRAVDPSGPVAAARELYRQHPEHFNSIGQADQSVPFSTLFTGVLLLNMFYWCTNQQIIQRAFAAKNLAEGQKGVLIAGCFKVMAPLILVLPGIIAYHLYHDTGLEPDQAYGRLVRDVLPRPLAGFFAAAIVGAILSSFNSVLNSTTTMFSLGVYRRLIDTGADEQRVIRAGKWFGWIVAIVTMCAAPFLAGQASIFNYLQDMNGIYFIPIFAVVVAGMAFRHVPGIAADMALVGGVAVISIGYFVPRASEWIKPVGRFHFLGIVFALLMLGLWIASLGRTEPDVVADRVKPPIDLTPWRWRGLVGGALIAWIVLIYALFAR